MINIGAGRFRLDGWANIDHQSDHYKKNNIDHDIDLLGYYALPFSSDTVKAVYSSHVIEHLDDNSVIRMIKESYRVLSRGGFLRITCPDARGAIDALIVGNEEFFNIYDSSICFNSIDFMERYHLSIPLSKATIYQKFLYFICPQRCIHVRVDCEKITDRDLISIITSGKDDIDIFNSIIGDIDNDIRVLNPWMHISWWTIKKLSSIIMDAGFSMVYQSQPGISMFEGMRDLHHFDWSLPKLSLYIEAVK